MTIIPRRYRCTGCTELFEFAHRDAVYHLSPEQLGTQVSDSALYPVPVRPGWCQDCARVCLVEDIQPLRAFEAAYAAVRSGMAVSYPKETEALDPAKARDDMAAYLRWRMNRVRPARALCCGGTHFQCLDVPQPLFKHAACDLGVVEAEHFPIVSFNGPGPGVTSDAMLPIYSAEAELLGMLTRRVQGSDLWQVQASSYPAAPD